METIFSIIIIYWFCLKFSIDKKQSKLINCNTQTLIQTDKMIKFLGI